MDIFDIAKRSLSTLWTNKHLWFFGFFVAAGTGGGGGNAEGHSGASHAGAGALPTWVFLLMGLALVVGLVFLVLHVLSEAALIEGVAEGQQGQHLSIRQGLRRGRKHFWKLVGLKLLFALIMGVTMAVVAAPAILAHFGLLPIWLGVAVAVLSGLVAIPFLLTVYFIYEYAMRVAVLEDLSAGDSIRLAKRFLHGRLSISIKLILLSIVGQLGGGMAMGLALIPAALLAGLAYLLGGVIAAAVVGGIVALPLMTIVMGATGTFRSSVWTLGFIDNHYTHTPVPAAEL